MHTKNRLLIFLMGIFSLITSPLAQVPPPVTPPVTISVSKQNPYQDEKFEVSWVLTTTPGTYDCIGIFPTNSPDQVVWRTATYEWIYARVANKTTFSIPDAGPFEIRYMAFDTTTRNTYNTVARSPLVTVQPLPGGNESLVILSKTNINVGDSIKATWIGSKLSMSAHYVGVYPTNVPLSHNGWLAMSYVNAVRWFKEQEADFFFEEPGTFEIRLVTWNERAQTTETLAVSELITVEELIPDPRDVTNYGRAGTGPIIAYGDSLTLGTGYGASSTNRTYPSALKRWLYDDTIPIINMGKGGETTAAANSRLQTVLDQNPSLVILGHGGYDYLQRVSTVTTFANLRTMIGRIQTNGAMVIIVGIQGGGYLDNSTSYRALAKETGSAYVPNVLRGILGNLKKLSDSVHPNDWGYDIMAERIAPFVAALTTTGPGPGPGPGPALTATRSRDNISLSANLGPGSHTLLWSDGVNNTWLPVLQEIRGNNLTFEIVPNSPQLFFKLAPDGSK